jgi:hypothetical protein
MAYNEYPCESTNEKIIIGTKIKKHIYTTTETKTMQAIFLNSMLNRVAGSSYSSIFVASHTMNLS